MSVVIPVLQKFDLKNVKCPKDTLAQNKYRQELGR